MEQYFIHGAMTEQAIDNVAEEAKKILKAPIKRRLHDLARRPKQTRMLKDLYNMAFDADLLGRSRILSSEGSAELIERAPELCRIIRDRRCRSRQGFVCRAISGG